MKISWKKNSALFCRYSAAMAARKTWHDDIAHFCAIAAITRYSAAKPK
jgi:hypothetical protein